MQSTAKSVCFVLGFLFSAGPAPAAAPKVNAVIQTQPLNFGSIAVDAAGSVTVSALGSRSTTGGVLALSGTTYTAAQFSVTTNLPSVPFAITFPTSATLSNGKGGKMTITDFQSSLVGNTGTTTGGMTQMFSVGATLNVNSGQATGKYQGTYRVTVNYN